MVPTSFAIKAGIPTSYLIDNGKETTFVKMNCKDGETLKLTPDHKVYTENRGWVEAAKLVDTDILILINE